MPYKYCQHIKENGIFCSSPAVKGRDYCYFHVRARARRLAIAKAKSQRRPWRLDLPPLEDMFAVQSAIMNVIEALAAGTLDRERGGLILYGLQQAATNLRVTQPWLGDSRFAIRHDNEMRVADYPTLEAEFGLEKNLDFDARQSHIGIIVFNSLQVE